MQDRTSFHPPLWTLVISGGLGVLGGFALAVGLLAEAPRAWANLFLVSNYLIGLALGGLVFLALYYVTGARWSGPLRRIPEALTALLPIGGVGLVAVLVLQPTLFSWSAASQGAEGHASPLRAIWLERPFFLLRALAYLALWLAFGWALVRNSRRQDQSGDSALTTRNVRLSAAFLVVFGVTCWLASADWLMSLEPTWSSSVFGVYNFAGLFLSALAAITLLTLCLRRVHPLRENLPAERLHDLGTLLFGFSSFWMYIWFCQYMLIWYTNHPHETTYFRRRLEGSWSSFLLADLVLNWGIPFLVLLFRTAKRSPVILAAVALVLLVGRWVDLFVMIAPSQGETLAAPGVLEAAIGFGAAGVAGVAVLWALGRAPLVPVYAAVRSHTPKASASVVADL
jgi:hypothetical protein